MPRIHFQRQLEDLKERLLAMAAKAEESLACAMDAYLLRDPGKARRVSELEAVINLSEREVDGMAYDLIAMEQPMAIDLRFLMAAIKINGDVERIGDQAHSIAERAAEVLQYPAVDLPVDMRLMSAQTSRMIHLAVQSLMEGDAEMARSVLNMDDQVDDANRDNHQRLVALMEQHPEWGQQALNAILISRNLERIADHATNIAEDVIFWVRGADVRHQLCAGIDD